MLAAKNLEVYKKSYKLAIEMHKHFVNVSFDKKFAIDLIHQVLRASRSVSANIAEGYGRREFQKEFARFLWIAVGSKDECMVHIDFLKDLGYLDEQTHLQFENQLEEIGKMLFGLISKIKSLNA